MSNDSGSVNTLMLIAAAIAGPSCTAFVPQDRKRRNVTACCVCGAKIGPGRGGRKCTKCRKQEGEP